MLRGGSGNDVLATNNLFGVPRPDGGPGTDTCHVPATEEGDVRSSCEIVETD